jgi:small-conductance mechanosensitive channel
MGLAVAACARPGDVSQNERSPDSFGVPDSSEVSAPLRDTMRVAAADSVVDTSQVLDSLLWQVARLEGMLVELRDANARVETSVDQNRREQIREDVSNFGLRAFWAIVVFTVAFFFIKFISWLLETLSERSAKRRLFFKKLIPISRILVWVIIVYYVVAGVFEVDRDGLLAAGAAVGVAIGFAAQDVLKNIFGGILIIMDQPFQVGDRVSVGGTYGEVVSIGLRSTRIVTPDDNLVSVPNTQVVDGQVANANAGALDCQVVTTLYLPGWVHVARAKEIAYDAAANSKYVYLKKPIVVLIKDDFKETFLTKIIVKAYVLDARYEAAFSSDVTETAKSQYLREGMLIDFVPGNYRQVEGADGGEVAP